MFWAHCLLLQFYVFPLLKAFNHALSCFQAKRWQRTLLERNVFFIKRVSCVCNCSYQNLFEQILWVFSLWFFYFSAQTVTTTLFVDAEPAAPRYFPEPELPAAPSIVDGDSLGATMTELDGDYVEELWAQLGYQNQTLVPGVLEALTFGQWQSLLNDDYK